jgi:hypothetical protein
MRNSGLDTHDTIFGTKQLQEEHCEIPFSGNNLYRASATLPSSDPTLT